MDPKVSQLSKEITPDEDIEPVRNMENLVSPHPGPEGKCKVCMQPASGVYFNAFVCLPCKTFFIRCCGEQSKSLVCRGYKNCSVVGQTQRSNCKYCRYKKCLAVGMQRKERSEHVELLAGQLRCNVCGDVANGTHFGADSCEGCKKFFARGIREANIYKCKYDKKCEINPKTRNLCRFCRYLKCVQVGMSKKNETTGGRSPKKRKHHEKNCGPKMNLSSSEKLSRDSIERSASPEDASFDYIDISHNCKEEPEKLRGVLADQNLSDYYGRDISENSSSTQTMAADLKPTHKLSVFSGDRDVSDSHFMSTEAHCKTVDCLHSNILLCKAGSNTSFQFSTGPAKPSQEIPLFHGLQQANIAYDSDSLNESLPSQHSNPNDIQYITSADRTRRGYPSLTGNDIDRKPDNYDICDNTSICCDTYIEKADESKILSQNKQDYCRLHSQSNGCSWFQGLPTLLSYGIQAGEGLPSHESDVQWIMHFVRTGRVSRKLLVLFCHLSQFTLRVQKHRIALPLNELLLSHPKIFAYTCYVFDSSYWIQPVLHMPSDEDDYQHITNTICKAYQDLVRSCRQAIDLPNDWVWETHKINLEVEKMIKLRLSNYVEGCIHFVQSLPGFFELDDADLRLMLRAGGIAAILIMSATEFYDPVSHSFRKRFDVPLQRCNPYSAFIDIILEFARLLSFLELDQTEVAFLCGLAYIASDFPWMRNIDLTDKLRHKVLQAFSKYTQGKYGERNYRIEMLFRFMPVVRQICQWDLTMSMVIKFHSANSKEEEMIKSVIQEEERFHHNVNPKTQNKIVCNCMPQEHSLFDNWRAVHFTSRNQGEKECSLRNWSIYHSSGGLVFPIELMGLDCDRSVEENN